MAHCCQSSLLGELEDNHQEDVHTYVIELPGVKAEAVKIRVSEGRFLIIEVQACKETVSYLEAEVKRARKKSRREMPENGRKFLEEIDEINRKLRDEIEEIDRRTQEQDKRSMEMMKYIKELEEKYKKKFPDLEEVKRMSQGEPTLPFGPPSADMVGYPFLHPTSCYMPSAFQQAYGGNNINHQSPATVTGVPSSIFPQAADILSGHGGFAGSANLPRNLSLDPSTKAFPASTYYSFQGQGHGQVQGQQQWISTGSAATTAALRKSWVPKLLPFSDRGLTRTPVAANCNIMVPRVNNLSKYTRLADQFFGAFWA